MVLEVTEGTLKGSFPVIPTVDADKAIRITKLEKEEEAGKLEWHKHKIYEKQRIFIFNCDLVETSVINTRAQCAILLFFTKKKSAPTRKGEGQINPKAKICSHNIVLRSSLDKL